MAQCTAMSKQSRQRCRRDAGPGITVCKIHGGGTQLAQAKAARVVAIDKARKTIDLNIDVEPPEALLGAMRKAASDMLALASVVNCNVSRRKRACAREGNGRSDGAFRDASVPARRECGGKLGRADGVRVLRRFEGTVREAGRQNPRRALSSRWRRASSARKFVVPVGPFSHRSQTHSKSSGSSAGYQNGCDSGELHP